MFRHISGETKSPRCVPKSSPLKKMSRPVAGCLKRPPTILEVELGDTAENKFGNLRLFHHVDEYLVDAAKVHGRLQLGGSVHPVAHEDDHFAGLPRRGHLRGDTLVVEPVGIWPFWIVLDFIERLRLAEWKVDDFLIGSALLSGAKLDGNPGHAKVVLDLSVRPDRQRRTNVPRTFDIAKVDVQGLQDLLLRGNTKMLPKPFADHLGRPIINREHGRARHAQEPVQLVHGNPW